MSDVPSTALWITATGLVWTIAGIMLFLWGWITLPRSRSVRAGPGVSRVVRIFAGAIIAGGAAVLGALLAGQGGLASQLAAAEISPLLLGVYLRESNGIALIGAGVSGAVGDVGVGFVRIGHFLATSLRLGAVTEGPYVVENLVAIAAAVASGAFVGWISWSSRWSFAGVATYIGLDLMALGFVAISLAVVETSTNGIAQALGGTLIGIVLFGFFLSLAYQFYVLEHIAGSTRPAEPPPGAVGPAPEVWPFVLVQVASFNEPPDVVGDCLRSVVALDYPKDRFAVQLCDDSTDTATVRELARVCADLGVDFQHRVARRGFKGGALNDGLAASSSSVDLIAIVDSDYVVDSKFLRRVVPEFRFPDIVFVQTPQAYRNVRRGGLSWWYELADAYFYRVVQPVRARHQSLIFCGTMGVLRRTALVAAGGWSESCVTEDAELTIRLLAQQGRGKYIPEVLGRGLAPDLMTAVRSQQRRWAFGGIQMLRINRHLLASKQLTFRQRLDFRMAGLFWFDGLFLVGVAAALASLVVASWFGVWLPYGAIGVPAIVAVAPVVLMLDGFVKIKAALRESSPVRYRDVLGVLTFWYAIKFNDLRAALRAWFGSKMTFVRTPKVPVREPSRWDAFRASARTSTAETAISLGLFGIVVTSLAVWRTAPSAVSIAYMLFLVWLVYYAYAFASAFWFDFASRLSLMDDAPPTLPARPARGVSEPARP
jgi:cellulose synthase/poly-beta-1,6-N-acetylglucosamine synthase-like glycosyltransferase